MGAFAADSEARVHEPRALRIGVGALLTVGTSSCLRSVIHFGAEFRRCLFTYWMTKEIL